MSDNQSPVTEPVRLKSRIVRVIEVPGPCGMYTYQPIIELVQEDDPQAVENLKQGCGQEIDQGRGR